MAGPYRGRAAPEVDYDKGYADISADGTGRLNMLVGPPAVAQAIQFGVRMARLGYIFDMREGFPFYKYLSRWFPGILRVLRLDMRETVTAYGQDNRIKSVIRLRTAWRNRGNRQVEIEFEARMHDDDVLRANFVTRI